MKTHKHMKNIMFYRFLTRTVFVFLFAAGCLLTAYAEVSQGNESIDSLITDKIFPFYNYVAHNQVFANIIQKDPAFKKQSVRQVKRIIMALEQCDNVTCYTTAAQWNPDEIAAIGNRLIQLCHDNPKMRRLLPLLKAGEHYSLYDTKTDTAFIRSVWNDAALGVNRILDTYIIGGKPRYPAIDSISFPIDDPVFRERVHRQLVELVKQHAPKDLFFKLPLQFALWALVINDRDEAARYEPLDQGMNKSAVESIPGIQWASFPYSLILVPGQGPEQEGLAIDPVSISRCRLAAERYQKGLAPLIVVSGGHVHPNKTPYSEAMEMKKYMVQELQIPENAILIEPHARHTTTNLRNTVRLAYRFKIPDNMKILTVTDSIQNAYIPKMGKRFMEELGYIPYRDLKILSAEENEFYPIKNALQVNSFDPLDP
jgi:hypothetical protein